MEPEVLCDGDHDLETAQKVTEQVTIYTLYLIHVLSLYGLYEKKIEYKIFNVEVFWLNFCLIIHKAVQLNTRIADQ